MTQQACPRQRFWPAQHIIPLSVKKLSASLCLMMAGRYFGTGAFLDTLVKSSSEWASAPHQVRIGCWCPYPFSNWSPIYWKSTHHHYEESLRYGKSGSFFSDWIYLFINNQACKHYLPATHLEYSGAWWHDLLLLLHVALINCWSVWRTLVIHMGEIPYWFLCQLCKLSNDSFIEAHLWPIVGIHLGLLCWGTNHLHQALLLGSP